MVVITPTDRPKSVRKRCVIEVFGAVFVLSRCFLDFAMGVRAFDMGLIHISSFFSKRDGAFILHACIPCGKTFLLVLKMVTL